MFHYRQLVSLINSILILGLVSVTSAFAQSDTEPPKLLSFSISPSSVDVTSSQQTVTVTMHLTDNLSGLDTTSGRGIGISFSSPSGIQTASGVPPKLSGTVLDATLSINIVVQKYVEPGTWKVGILRLADNAGNTIFLNFADVAAAGFPAAFEVIDATPDVQAPQLAGITFSPSSVDVTNSDATITVDMTLTDNLAGVGWSSITLQEFVLQSPSGKQNQVLSPSQFTLVSGTLTNGTWRATLKMPRFSESGTWKVSSIRLQDLVRNTRTYDAIDLAAFGSSIELGVSSSVSDITPPQVVAMTFNPAFVNSSSGPQTVQVEMTITDDLSGVSFHSDTPQLSLLYGVTFRSPSGAQFRNTNSVNFTGETAPVSGTQTNGTWRFNVNLPQFSEEGTWNASSLVKDRTRNVVSYSATDLASHGLPNQLVVIRSSLQTDGSITDPAVGGTVSDTAFGTRASLIVPAGVFFQPTSIAIDVLQSPLGVPLPSGFSTAETYFMNVELTPNPGYPLPAPGITVIIPLRNYQIPGTTLNLFYVDATTGALLPYLDASGQPLKGIVDPGGLSATFYGVNHFTTIVGLLPDAIHVDVDIKPGETTNVINPDSKGSISVAIMSTPTFDVTKVDWGTVTCSGAHIAQNKKGGYQVSIVDVNGDGLDDVIAHFQTAQLLLGPSDTQAVVEGQTPDDRQFRGTDSVRILK